MQTTSPPTSWQAPSSGAPTEHTASMPLRAVLIVASLGAAAIHFAFAPVHLDENTLHGLFFMAIAWFGVAWSLGLMLRRPTRSMFLLGAVVNLAIIATWVVTRTVGISGEVEAVSFPDVLATALEGVIVLGAVVHLTTRAPRLAVREISSAAFVGASAVAVVALVTASMVPALGGGHHGHGHDATAAVTTSATSATAHDQGAHDVTGQSATAASSTATAHAHAATPVPYDPTKPIDLSGTPGVTPAQQAAAENLIAVTLVRLPKWSDQAVALAAGFRSINDGGTGIEHLVNEKFMNDDVILDPDQPESLVYDTTGGGRKLVAAMYMVKPGTPLDQVPNIGGALMQWHVHTNLCYNAQGHVAGITNAQGECPAGLVKPVATPMIHVWLTPNKCGPFAALEGIGGGDIKPGEQRLCDQAHGGH